MIRSLIKRIGAEDVNIEVKIYEEEVKRAIEVGFESLYFSANQDRFAEITVKDVQYILKTTGEVRIKKDDELYTNKHEDEIIEVLNKGQIEECYIDNNNWFAIIELEKIGEDSNGQVVYGYGYDEVYEDTPINMDEFVESVVDYAIHLYEIKNNIE